MTDPGPVLAAFDALFHALTEAGDAAAGTALFADEDDVLMWGSAPDERAVGRPAIGELHRAIVALPARLAFAWEERHVRVAGDAAWVNAAGTLTVEPASEPARTTPYRLTAVLIRRERSWCWHTFNGSEPAA